eukprot:GHVR01063317.1.p1 GENE.GHVR01063317.1~~GHVR01063317.1.p1  ORF type:complete len:135 (+),score=10.40 GHVR01063317.1:537-941(+)
MYVGYEIPQEVFPIYKSQYIRLSNDIAYYNIPGCSVDCSSPSSCDVSSYLDNIRNLPIYLKKNGVTVDVFDYGDVYTDSYVKRKNETSPNGNFVLNDWLIPGKGTLYYSNYDDATMGCPIPPMNTFQCIVFLPN